MKLNNQKGFSLIQVMIAVGIMAALSVTYLKQMSAMNQGQKNIDSNFDEIALKSQVYMLLQNKNFCRISLAGIGIEGLPSSPVVFKREDIDNPDALADPSKDIHINLYYANQDGDQRTQKILNGAEDPNISDPSFVDKSKFGQLIIDSLKLYMNNGSGNYADTSFYSEMGIIRMRYRKQRRKDQFINLIHDFPITIGMSTGQSPEASGETRIINCDTVSPFLGGVLDYDVISVTIPRGGVNSTTVSIHDYRFCALSRVSSGGDEGGGNDYCEVSRSSLSETWKLSGRRGDDPDIICKMMCMK